MHNAFYFPCTVSAIFWAAKTLKMHTHGVYIKRPVYKGFEPIDIFLPLWKSIKMGKLDRRCEKIVMWYGHQSIIPPTNSKDYTFWKNTVHILDPILTQKNIVKKRNK